MMFKNLNFRTKIWASTVLVVLLFFSSVIFIVSINSMNMAKTLAYQIAEETASNNGTYVRAELEGAMNTARTLSYTFQEMKLSHNADRATMTEILFNILKDNPQFVGTWTVWEPNALDGRDAEFINSPAHDKTGRFVPYWSKYNGEVHLVPLLDYDTPSWDYYLLPKKNMKETIISPYIYPIADIGVFMTSVVVPIIVEGEFLGAVGIDIALDTIQNMVSKIKPLETGNASLISNEGEYIANNDRKLIGKVVEDSQAKEAIKLGKSYTTTNNGLYEIYVPITIGRTSTPWSMAVSVPIDRIFQQANNIRNFAIIIGFVALLSIGLVIFLVASSITNQHLKTEVWERRQIQERVLRLASIVESTDEGIIGMTLDGIIIDWNRGAESIYGYSEEEILGESVLKLIPQNKHLEHDQILLNVSRGMPITHYETTRQRKDGQIIHVYYTASPIKDHTGKTVGVSTIFRDVTAQKKMEKEMIRMDQMNLIGEIAASIGHEVRNPMTTVKGFLQLIEENGSSSRFSDYIPLMISELDRANSIITEFLAISRTKATEFAQHNLNDIITYILPLIQADAIRGDKWITVELGEVPDLLLDDKEIRQVIINLARNGLEATGKGGGLKAKTYCTDNELVLAIQDEGTGIDPEIMDKLGTPFLTTKENGTGLGLAVCYGIAARHNAEINVETSPLGSTFFVKFKLQPGSQLSSGET